jgi:hypothetical protein
MFFDAPARRACCSLLQGEKAMSRAFVKEDDDEYEPERTFALPAPNTPGYAEASAHALLEAARDNVTAQAESATGYRWGHPDLVRHVQSILHALESVPFEEQDRRMIQVASRYLRAAGADHE